MTAIDDIKKILGEEIKKSGTAFYSHVSTLKKGQFLILGLNPGGDPSRITTTIEMSLNHFKQDGYNAYYEQWLESGREHRLQRNLRELFSFLGHDLRDICATNLFYERTKSERLLSFSNLPVYREILRIIISVVDPKVIITFGNRPFASVIDYFRSNLKSVRLEDSKHGKWKIQFATIENIGNEIKVIGLPHLSIYTLYNRPEVMAKIKDFAAIT